MKRKIVVTTGTRAEYGILRPVLRSIQKSSKLELYLIVTGMHLSKKHGMTINEIKKDGFKVFKTILMMPKDDTSYSISIALGKEIIAFSKIFHKIKPDINIVLGDRDEMLASAIAAYHMNIPNAHIHGGDKSGGIDEYTRHAITKMSNIHFAASQNSKRRLIMLGENPKYVFLTGSPGVDEVVNSEIAKKKDLEKIYNIKFSGDEILLLYHPVTTESELSGKQIQIILESIVRLGKNTIAIAPNNDAGSRAIYNYLKSYSEKYNFIKLYPSMPRKHFLGMLENCRVLVGNSSSGMIEASYFQIPVINIGIRQEGRERGLNVIDVKDVTRDSIRNAIVKAWAVKVSKKNMNTYGRGAASKKIVKCLEKIRLNKDLIQKKISY